MAVLQACDLRVLRSGQEVLAGVRFEVHRGETYALLGGNGAGKSTTLAAFLGFLPVAGGQARVLGRAVGEDLPAARRALAYLPEAASLYEHLDARENLRYFLRLAGVQRSPADIDAALDQVSLDAAARARRLRHHSKGMRQKVAIALALLRDTEILLLDEPTSGLDPLAIDEFHRLIQRLAAAGKAILMVTHDLLGACVAADRMGLLHRGRLVAEFAAPAGGRIDAAEVHRAFSAARAA